MVAQLDDRPLLLLDLDQVLRAAEQETFAAISFYEPYFINSIRWT